jgi:hypothetical protein
MSNPWRPIPLGIAFYLVGLAAFARALYLATNS